MPRVLRHAFSTFNLGGAQARIVQLANTLGLRYRYVTMAMDGCVDTGARRDAAVAWNTPQMANHVYFLRPVAGPGVRYAGLP